ncbi:DMT family transporter [Pseudomonas gingeri]|uniref:DMT family transporter n=1 Tax=Pseudomonas gingeri TaxID=117681 RepID=UPI0015A3CF0B|nr:DMT family transporter [Pseudomonas gingeri]NWE47541.1 DMT family transporter [Pseudomonas gingeri]
MKKSALVAFVFLGLIWGSNFIFVKWAAHWISPLQITLLRVVFGFLPVLFFALAKDVLRWSHMRHARHFVVMSLLATALYYYAFAKGAALLPSSVAGVLSGAIPLFTFICTALFLNGERINRTRITGVILGFIGVLLIARPWSATGDISLTGVAYMIGGSLSVGASFVYARRFISPLGLPAAALTTYQIGLAMLFLLAVTPLQGIDAVFGDSRAWVGLVVGLGLLGTGMAYVAYYHIVESLGAIAASSVTYIPPIVALLIGVFLAGEHLNTPALLAILFILAGVACLQFDGLAGSRQISRKRRTNE